jgi:dienelactone hydrolase
MTIQRVFAWLAKAFARVFLFMAVALALLFTLLWFEHKTPITLPALTGRFTVGRTTRAWVNNEASDELAPSPGAKREVVVWIWYPSAAVPATPPAEYLPAPWRAADAQYTGALMKFLTRDLTLVGVHSKADAHLSSEQRRYPVVIMRAGGGAYTTDFTTLAEDLASHGYVVVGFDAPYRTSVVVFPDNRVVTRRPADNPESLNSEQANRLINRLLPMWTSDTKFVVDQLEVLNAADPSGKFTARLDMERLGMFGHSFGGATALQFCREDSRCKAGIDIDGAPYGSVVQDGLKQPFMFLLSDHSREMSDAASRQIQANIQSIYEHLPGGRLLITVRGAHHFSFSDQALLKSRYLMSVLTTVGGFGRLDSRRGLAITADYVHAFFDVYLKGEPPDLLTGLSTQYPEIQCELR